MNNQKSTRNVKSTWALILSIVAILLCLLVFILWIFEAIPHSVISSESFIGACVTLLGVIVTIAVGWQIFNAIEMRQMMRQLEEKQKSIDEAQLKLDSEVRKNYNHSLHLHHVILGQQHEMEQKYAHAVFYYIGALYAGISLHMPYDTNDYIFMHIKSCLVRLREKTNVPAQMYKELGDIDALIRASEEYHWIRTQYEPLFEEFKTKIIAQLSTISGGINNIHH